MYITIYVVKVTIFILTQTGEKYLVNTQPDELNHKISFLEAFLYWLKLGFISFGGPAGQISMMHHELVEKRRWISEHRFLHALNYCMVLPGPEAQQLAVYIGWLMHGTWGGIMAGMLFVLPSLGILLALTYIYLAFGSLPIVAGILYGIKPAVVAIVIHAAYRIGSRALKNEILWGIAAIAFVAIFIFNIPFPIIVLGAGILGFIGSKVVPDKFTLKSGHGSGDDKNYGAAIIDDHTPLPERTQFKKERFFSYLIIGLAIWGGVMAMLALNYGWEGAFTQMGWFFTKAALLTFGGAYAVLPYVYQGGVEHYGWLTAPQMIDGLALGETTPGPLIMIVAFVGFVGGWTKQIFGGEMLLWAGMVGGSIATFFTFLPSFLFILLGAPLIETTRQNLNFSAPLTGITAAVVGVILNLAVFFAYHVFFPQGFNGKIEGFAIFLSIASFIALFKFNLNIMLLIPASAFFGLVYMFV